jgi:L-threonylcarbamoyladenylate synthase
MTRRLVLDPDSPDPKGVAEAAAVIRRGGLVILPTDTAYGLAGDPKDPAVVERILTIKERKEKNGMPVLAANVNQVRQVVTLSQVAETLAQRFWPGALTLILPTRRSFPEGVLGPDNTLAVRVPNHLVALHVIRYVGFPVTGTSANRSGAPSPRTVEEATGQLGPEVDLVLDAGATRQPADSTILDCTAHPLRVVRAGAVPETALQPWLELR